MARNTHDDRSGLSERAAHGIERAVTSARFTASMKSECDEWGRVAKEAGTYYSQ
jgi:hypothetical protein